MKPSPHPQPRDPEAPVATPRRGRWAAVLAVSAVLALAAALIVVALRARDASPVDVAAVLAELRARDAALVDSARRGEPDPDGRAALLADLRDLARLAPEDAEVAALRDAVQLRDLRYRFHDALESGSDAALLLSESDGLLERTPESVEAWVLNGQMRLTRGDREGARASFTQATSIRADDPALFDLIGALWMQAGHPDEAAQAYTSAIALSDGRLDRWLALGLARAGEGRLDDAVQAYARGAEVDATEPRLLSAWAEAESRLGRHGRAAELWSAAVRWGEARGIEPESVWSYRLAQARGALRRGDPASAWSLVESLPDEARALPASCDIVEQTAQDLGEPGRASRFYMDLAVRLPADAGLLERAEAHARASGDDVAAERYAEMRRRIVGGAAAPP
ncbi:MAG: hypothetical protein AAF288_02795 [Planctomycetota bacterium]